MALFFQYWVKIAKEARNQDMYGNDEGEDQNQSPYQEANEDLDTKENNRMMIDVYKPMEKKIRNFLKQIEDSNSQGKQYELNIVNFLLFCFMINFLFQIRSEGKRPRNKLD